MGEILVVTSLKGGVGKTVLSAGLCYEWARQGKRVLAVDMDLGTGGLDIALGREDMICATLLDLLEDKIPQKEALTPGKDGVTFLSSPIFFGETSFGGVLQFRFNALLAELKEKFDFLLFDMPAGGGAAFPFLEKSDLVDRVLLVTTSAPTSVRAAERCAMRLKNPEKCKLVLNGYRFTHPEDNPFSVSEIIQRASVPIIGVIPRDGDVEKALETGVPLTGRPKSEGGKAIANIAKRLAGEEVPLLSGVVRKRKRFRFY